MLRGAAVVAAALAGALAGPSAAASPEGDPGPITDPDDAPFMEPPRGQLRQWSAGRSEPLTRPFSPRRRLQLTVLPSYASVRMPLLGRHSTSCGGLECPAVRGGGIGIELDVRILRWLWLRVGGSHTVHPVQDSFTIDEETEEVQQIARAGTLGVSSFGLSGVYPLDLGRFMPLLDVGLGGMVVTSPKPAISGQMGAQCRDGGECDTGLSCGGDDVCRPTIIPEVHAGVGLDVLLGRSWTLGAQIRYYALLPQVSVFPSYIVGALRLAARF